MTTTSAAKNIAVTAVMAAILITSKFMLALVPNVEVITPLVIIFTCSLGFKRTFFAVLVFCLIDNLIYSFHYLVTIQYFFHWPLLCVLSFLIKKYISENFIVFAFLALLSALLFWVETPLIASIFQFTRFAPMLYAGIPFMIPMAAGSFIFTFIAYIPLYTTLNKINNMMFYSK